MEKVDLYVKKILALILSASTPFLLTIAFPALAPGWFLLSIPFSLLMFSYLDFRITGDKPRFLFGMNQSDAFLSKKGGFWNLFKWIVTTLGFAYDMLVWVVWGVFLIFMLVVDFLMLVKFIVFWIIRAVIWFVRQFFPPFIFIFKMLYHYLIKWGWWIYKLTFRNIKISVNRNFYFISLWGAVLSLFIVFLFFAISQWVGLPQLIVISAVFAIIPLVWSYGEIAALRFDEREKEDYGSVKMKFSNGFDAVRSILFYIILAVVLIAAEIVLNLLGWIPNLSMSLLGITLNINMAISIVLIFLVFILMFADMILPSHILYKPEHGNDVNSSLTLFGSVARRILRYLVAHIPASVFALFLLVIPAAVVVLSFQLTDKVKDGILENRIEALVVRADTLSGEQAEKYRIRATRMAMYKDMPLRAAFYFDEYIGKGKKVAWQDRIDAQVRAIEREKMQHNEDMEEINAAITLAETSQPEPTSPEEVLKMSNQRLDLEESHFAMKAALESDLSVMKLNLQEIKRVRIQMPILYLFVGIFFAVFGGLVFAVLVSYLGNIYFELYNFREDGKPTHWQEVARELNEKDPNQPLLGFTFLVIFLVPVILFLAGVL
jgi:hypothetical protein